MLHEHWLVGWRIDTRARRWARGSFRLARATRCPKRPCQLSSSCGCRSVVVVAAACLQAGEEGVDEHVDEWTESEI